VQIQGSTALITGATGGIGHAIARALHARGAKLILTGRRSDVLEPLATALGSQAVAADLLNGADVKRLLEEAGEVDVLVANAALPAAARLQRMSEADVNRALDVNLRAPIALTHALLPGMLERRRGHLVFISSTGGKVTGPGNPLYHATKFGIRGFAGAMRIDLHGTGVGVSCVLPGFIREAGLFAESGATLPLGVGTRSPEDVASAVVKAIEDDVAEIEVTSLLLRVGSLLWSIAPDLSAAISRRMGSEAIADTYEHALHQKR